MSDVTIRTVSELVDVLKKFQFQFGRQPSFEDFIFRGTKNEKYHLLPKVFRSLDYSGYELEMLSRFSKNAHAFLPSGFHEADFSLLQYAQHYGVPTRLLDFTTNPLIALYFCCEDISKTDGALWIVNVVPFRFWAVGEINEQNLIDDPFLYWTTEEFIDNVMKEITNPSDADENYPKLRRPVFSVPPYIDQRMSAQSSCFMLWGRRHEPLEDMATSSNYMKLHHAGARLRIEDDKRFLAKIIIPNEVKRDIVNELDLLDINEKSLFPGLDGIGHYIEKHYRNDSNSES